MRTVLNKLTSTPLKRYLFVVSVIIILVLLVAYIGSFYSSWRENQLIAQYLNDPQKSFFAELLRRDQKDLASNPERARRIGITMDMGLQWYGLAEYDLAVKWWRRGLSIEPNNDIGWYNLGNAYRELRQYPNAENAYKESMEVSTPGEIDACLALGEMYRYAYTYKKDKEPDVYLECLEKHKQDRDLIARLAIYYRDVGDKPNAIKYFDQLWSIDPTQDVSEELRKLGLQDE